MLISSDLVTRVLYRLRFASEQRPFDAASLIYMLPLIQLVLEKGSIDKPAGELSDEQIILAIEALAFHAEQCWFSIFFLAFQPR